jgi:antitoxin HigA-1
MKQLLACLSLVTPDTALRLGTWLGNGPELWLNVQQAYDRWHVRVRLGAALGKIKPMLSDMA